MNKFLGMDSPFIRFATKLADIIWLNVITLVCCIPIITAGSAITSMNYMLIKIIKNEEGYITRSFFKQFIANFKKATITWLIFLIFISAYIIDIVVISHSDTNQNAIMNMILLVAGFYISIIMIYTFALMAWFDNSVLMTLKNAVLLSFACLPRTVLMIITWIVFYLIIFFVPMLMPLVILLGLSAPSFICAKIYIPIFEKLANDDA